MKKLCGLCVLGLVGSLGANQELIETGAEVDEVVAESGMAAPASVLRPLAAQIPFVAFRYPHVDADQNVTFIADDPIYTKGGENHGIFRSLAAGGPLVTLVRAGETEVPGEPGVRFDYVRGLQTDESTLVFNARDTAGEWGWYRWDDYAIRSVVRTGETVLPAETVPVTYVGYGNVVGQWVLVQAETNDAKSLALFDGDIGVLRGLLRADGTTPIPGREDDFFRYLSPQNWMDERDVVFRAARADSPHTLTSRKRGDRGIYGWFDVDLSDAAAFDLENLVTVADWETEVPLMPGKVFKDVDSAPVDDGLVAFAASGDDFRGVYAFDSRAATPGLTMVADTQMAIESLFEGPFRTFGAYLTVDDRRVVFIGYARDYVGVFCYRVDQPGKLYLLADNRALVDGKEIVDFELAKQFFSGERFALTAEFEDRTSGVYLATVPDEGLELIRE